MFFITVLCFFSRQHDAICLIPGCVLYSGSVFRIRVLYFLFGVCVCYYSSVFFIRAVLSIRRMAGGVFNCGPVLFIRILFFLFWALCLFGLCAFYSGSVFFIRRRCTACLI